VIIKKKKTNPNPSWLFSSGYPKLFLQDKQIYHNSICYITIFFIWMGVQLNTSVDLRCFVRVTNLTEKGKTPANVKMT